jgi:membrane-bound ClpP family serine protease
VSLKWISLLVFLGAAPAVAEQPPIPRDRPSVTLPADAPDAIAITGFLSPRTVDEFWAALEARPHAVRVLLNSGGGQLWATMTIAEYIYRTKMRTVVVKDGSCFSGCAFMFLAGAKRVIEPGGQLGVHQTYVPPGEVDTTEASRADQFDQLRRFGVGDAVISAWLRTPNSSNRIFTPAEVIAWGIVTPLPQAGPVTP